MCWRFVQDCIIVGSVVCAAGMAILLKAAQKLLAVLAQYFLVAVLAALALASTSWAVWAVLCCSSLVGSGAGVLSTRVGVGDGDVGRYSIETSSSSSLRGWRLTGWTGWTGSILIFGREALK